MSAKKLALSEAQADGPVTVAAEARPIELRFEDAGGNPAAGTRSGPLVGGLVMVAGDELLRFTGDLQLLIFGLAVVLVIMFMRDGLVRKLFRNEAAL